MSLLDDKMKNQVREALSSMKTDVELVVFRGGSLVIPGRDPTGEQRSTLQLLGEIAALSERVAVIERNLAGDEEAQRLGLDLAPTTLLRERGSERGNIRFIGFPGGYEFSTLISTLLMLGGGDSGLKQASLERLGEIRTPVTLRSFVTPTCPHCPQAVLTAFSLAYHNPLVTAEGIEASEFPLLSQRNRISGVPDTLISGERDTRLLGAQPVHAFLDAVLQAASGAPAA